MKGLGKFFIIIGVISILLGILLLIFPNIFKFFGKLPGDIVVKKENFVFYAPITSMLLLSVILTIILNLLTKLLGK